MFLGLRARYVIRMTMIGTKFSFCQSVILVDVSIGKDTYRTVDLNKPLNKDFKNLFQILFYSVTAIHAHAWITV